MGIQVVATGIGEAQAVASALLAQLRHQRLSLCVVFAPEQIDACGLARALRRQLPASARLIGVSTAGEIVASGYAEQQVQMVAFASDEFVVTTVLLAGTDDVALAEHARRIEHAYAALRQDAMPGGRMLALMYIDGLSLREEALGHAAQLVLGNVPVLGGSAGDALHFRRTWVLFEDEIHERAAVLALLSTRRPFALFKAQHFVRTTRRLVITGARPSERVVTEINGLPAAQEYARMVRVPVEELDARVFAAHPLVVRIGGTEYVRSLQRANPDHSLSFFCAIDEGLVLTLARPVNAVASIEQALSRVEDDLGEVPELILGCDCILRRLEFVGHHILAEVGQVLSQHRVIGFSSYGELYKGVHVNQTLTGIAFGSAPGQSTE